MDQATKDRLAALAAGKGAPAAAATKTKAQVTVKAATQTHEEEDVHISERTGLELKIKENPFYQLLNANSTATQEEKITQLADAVDPKQHTMTELQENYRLIQEFYTYIQSEELEQVLENVKRIIAELEGRSKVETAAIVRTLRDMLADTKTAQDLVEVLRRSRLSGKTVEELSAALDRNDAIVKQLGDLDGKKKSTEADKAAAAAAVAEAKRMVDDRTREREEKEGTFGFKLGNFFKKNTTWSDRVTAAQTALDRRQTVVAEKDGQIAKIQTDIATLEGQRDVEFEKEPLKILRSLDEADNNLSQKLISMGKNGVSTVQKSQKSVLELMQRALGSETAVDEISKRVAEKGLTLNTLRSGMELGANRIQEFKTGKEAESVTADAALEEARANGTDGTDGTKIFDIATKGDAAQRLKNTLSELNDFHGKINGTINEFDSAVAENTERVQQTDTQKQVVQGTKKSLTVLARGGLNAVANDLEGVLHNLISDQTDETSLAINEFTKAAQGIREGAMEGMMNRSKDQHEQDMKSMTDAAAGLKRTQDRLEKAITMAVEQNTEATTKRAEFKAAVKDLDDTSSFAHKIEGEMQNRQKTEEPAPTAPADVAPGRVFGGDQPKP